MLFPVSQHFTWMEHHLTTSLRKHFTYFPYHWRSLSHKVWFNPTYSIWNGAISHCWEPLSYRSCVWLTASTLHKLKGLGFSCLSQLLKTSRLPLTVIKREEKSSARLLHISLAFPLRSEKMLSIPLTYCNLLGRRWQLIVASCSSLANLEHNKKTKTMKTRNTQPPKTQTRKTWSSSSANYKKDCPKQEIIVPLQFRTKFYLIKKLQF